MCWRLSRMPNSLVNNTSDHSFDGTTPPFKYSTMPLARRVIKQLIALSA
ncbi:hypothetical protein [Pseudomonas umsongensis]|uniref:Uncharacterized protein n=1 Tax=Pseudomonas umsongensis TaxID=198618 RepID=A0AAE7DDY4_9PSED|nr:hypothetical protein [Pseudomonas umsongensis]QJC78974.1 hypothetical protein HGP31_11860 [Pseudomonas umsongensis]